MIAEELAGFDYEASRVAKRAALEKLQNILAE
jgi:hypothetical protein